MFFWNIFKNIKSSMILRPVLGTSFDACLGSVNLVS